MNKAIEAIKKITVGGIAVFLFWYAFAMTFTAIYFLIEKGC